MPAESADCGFGEVLLSEPGVQRLVVFQLRPVGILK
jgi:hypothetical protein